MKAAFPLHAAVLLTTLVAAPLAAQRADITLDAGAAGMRFADSIHARSISLSPQLRLIGGSGTLTARGTLSQLEGVWTNSGRLDASFVPYSAGQTSGELTLIAGGSSHANGSRTGQLLGSARLHIGQSSAGGWIGGGVGRTWDGSWRDVRQGEAGGWLRLASSTIVGTIAPAVVDDSIRYVDGLLFLHSDRPAWDFDVSLGYRAGQQLPSLPANRSVWGQLAAVFWLTGRVGVVAAAGSYPVDFMQGYPGGQYVSLGMRIRSGQRFVPPSAIATSSRDIREFAWTRVQGDVHRIRLQAGAARTVELMADFTQWRPVTLRHDGRGRFSTLIELPKGTHEVNVRVDGGKWVVPPGTIPRTDEFGGAVGLFVVR